MGQAYPCPAGHCVILPGLCMMSGAGSLPQGIQKKSKCPRIQVLFLAPQLSWDISGTAATVRARMGGRGHQASQLSSSGLPVTNYEDVFLLDPLLACGQRIPLYLSKPPQQVRGSLPPGFPFLSMQGVGGQTSLPVFSGNGLSEAAAPTCHHVPLCASLLISGLLFHLAERGRDDCSRWSAADEPGRAEL